MGVFDEIVHDDYEQVVFNYDRASGLKSIIAIHSTALGPAIGGTRFYPYETEGAALADALKLARAMTYKCAAAGLDHGGGKAVIIGDPKRDKTEQLFRSYGRFVDTLGGRFITGEDVGTAREDCDTARRETRWIVGTSEVFGGSGDPSPVTASGIYTGLRAVAMELWKKPELKGRRFAVQGLGKVGYHVVKHLIDAGAQVVVADVDVDNLGRGVSDFKVDSVPHSEILGVECDVLVPCALGGVLNERTIPELKCAAVAGAANNQLESPLHAKLLEDAGILYAPDFIINSGGLINVADELRGYDRKRALAQVEGIYHRLMSVFQTARMEKMTTLEAANRVAEERIRRVSRIKLIQVGPRPDWL